MPRQRKATESGYPPLAVKSQPGVRYGEGQQLQTLNRNMPTPNMREAPVAAPSSTATGAPPTLPTPATEGLTVDPFANLPRPGLLLAPTTRPAEPITAGLRTGAGPGPEVLATQQVESPTGRFLRDMSRILGRPEFFELARKSGL